jgi:hypothetical protein
MLRVIGGFALLFGIVGFGGQLLSVVDWPLAQRLGLQEADEHADRLFRHLERNTAIWDLATWWSLPAAGVLMLFGHDWWPVAALFAGGIYFDTAGREVAKILGLSSQGVRTGTTKDARGRLVFFGVAGVIGLAVAIVAALEILAQV